MQVAALFLRAIDDNGCVYPPYVFANSYTGDVEWTEEEKDVIRKAIDPYVDAKVDAMFNTWLFSKHADDHFTGKRSTWQFGLWSCYTAKELADKIAEYYK